jgi:hypothetical protein
VRTCEERNIKFDVYPGFIPCQSSSCGHGAFLICTSCFDRLFVRPTKHHYRFFVAPHHASWRSISILQRRQCRRKSNLDQLVRGPVTSRSELATYFIQPALITGAVVRDHNITCYALDVFCTPEPLGGEPGSATQVATRTHFSIFMHSTIVD